MKNIVDNHEDEKYKSIKKQNKMLQACVAKHKGGLKVMELVGFSESKNQEGHDVWTNKGSLSYVKSARLDLAAGLS